MSTDIPRKFPPVSFWKQARGIFRWLGPSVALAIIPKCPACLAAYLALGTGLAVSLTVAATIRYVSVALCASFLVWLAMRKIMTAYRKNRCAVLNSKTFPPSKDPQGKPRGSIGKMEAGLPVPQDFGRDTCGLRD
jgi:hypothetical protein